MRGDLPVGQDLLTYSPPGGTTLLPMTVAIDIRGVLTEEELQREPNAVNWNGHSYTRIRKKGTITLTSFRTSDSDMHVTVSLAGKAEAISGDGSAVIDDYHASDWQGGAYWLNNHSDLAWKLTLTPSETVTLTYEVTFYVR